jgi:beta-xylosidase
MTFGGVDTYYDYNERQWRSRRLGGGPVRTGPACPLPTQPQSETRGNHAPTDQQNHDDPTPDSTES